MGGMAREAQGANGGVSSTIKEGFWVILFCLLWVSGKEVTRPKACCNMVLLLFVSPLHPQCWPCSAQSSATTRCVPADALPHAQTSRPL